MEEEYHEGAEDGYYDEWGEWHVYEKAPGYEPPVGHHVDAHGRLLGAPPKEEDPWEPEEYSTFVSEFKAPYMAAKQDGMSKYAWPDIPEDVRLQRLDIFEVDYPKTQQATTDRQESQRIRATPPWYYVQSIFMLNVRCPYTREIQISSTGPPRRHRYLVKGKSNARDLATWVDRECILPYIGSDRIPGTGDFSVDYCDGPDRYFINEQETPDLGRRRLYRFAAYPATQYYILEKRIYHKALESEGGSGLSYKLERGPYCFMQKGWKLIGSFFAFDRELTGSSLFTVYARDDPFPRMHICVGPIARPEEWRVQAQFYAFDIPLPGTCFFTVQHCTRSIYTAAANVSRMRLTTADATTPWEFRMMIYVYPAELYDTQLTPNRAENGRLYVAPV